jgi:hypothetical protein
MKTLDVLRALTFPLIAVLALAASQPSRAETLAQWNFNSVPPDETNNYPTGTLVPILGAGTASLVGGATATFASATGSSDPQVTDDSGWNTAGYPAQGTGNKTRGVQFNVSTLGYERIMVAWDHRNSSTSSKYIRFQYSTNGTNFIDGPSMTISAQDAFFARSVDLTSLPVVNNKSNFAFRIVSEWESTAIGNETNQYIATGAGATYSGNGTWRFDMVTVSGEVFSGNEFPTISTISNQTIRMNTLSDEFPFIIGDAETPANDLNVAASSSDLVLLPNENIFLMGTGSNRTVRVFPAAGQSGVVTVTITVTDGIGNATSMSFRVTVLPDNTAPVISSFTNYHAVVNAAIGPISFVIGDAESEPDVLSLAASSSNPMLIPNAGLSFEGSGSNRTLTITPALEQTGNAVITVTVDDGALSATRTFAVMVLPSSSVVLCESFAYPDGPVTVNSGFRWSNHSGIAGQTQVTAEELRMTSAQTEDISATLIGAPFTTNRILYVAFTVNYKSAPGPGDYFAHFREPGSSGVFRARVFGTTTNVQAGSHRLAIGNATGNITNAAVFPADLALETEYLVVVRYDIATAVSTLWVNPRSEGDTNVVATDTAAIVDINSWAFRQSGGIGALYVDDLKVGFSFADVLPGYRLRIERTGSSMAISWPAAATDEGYVLESTGTLTTASWATVIDVPVRNGLRDSVTNSAPTGSLFYRLVK